MKETIKLKKEAKHHRNETSSVKKTKAKYHDHLEVHKQVPWLRNRFTRSKAMMMMNGPLLLNSIQNFLRKKSSLRKWERNNSRKKSKKNLISRWRKKEEKNKDKKNKAKSISGFNKNKPSSMTKGKSKRKTITKEKSNSKRKWETDKSRTKARERKSKKRKKMNSISCWSKRSRRKSP